MIGGFALIAFPAQYGVWGVTTFMVRARACPWLCGHLRSGARAAPRVGRVGSAVPPACVEAPARAIGHDGDGEWELVVARDQHHLAAARLQAVRGVVVADEGWPSARSATGSLEETRVLACGPRMARVALLSPFRTAAIRLSTACSGVSNVRAAAAHAPKGPATATSAGREQHHPEPTWERIDLIDFFWTGDRIIASPGRRPAPRLRPSPPLHEPPPPPENPRLAPRLCRLWAPRLLAALTSRPLPTP